MAVVATKAFLGFKVKEAPTEMEVQSSLQHELRIARSNVTGDVIQQTCRNWNLKRLRNVSSEDDGPETCKKPSGT